MWMPGPKIPPDPAKVRKIAGFLTAGAAVLIVLGLMQGYVPGRYYGLRYYADQSPVGFWISIGTLAVFGLYFFLVTIGRLPAEWVQVDLVDYRHRKQMAATLLALTGVVFLVFFHFQNAVHSPDESPTPFLHGAVGILALLTWTAPLRAGPVRLALRIMGLLVSGWLAFLLWQIVNDPTRERAPSMSGAEYQELLEKSRPSN